MTLSRENLKQLILDSARLIYTNKHNQQHVYKKIDPFLKEQIILSTEGCREERFSERVFWILKDIYEYPICIECGKQWKPRFFGLSTKSFNEMEFCSLGCQNKNGQFKERIKISVSDRYGVEYISQTHFVKEKVRQKNLELFGVECSLQNKEVRDKGNITILEKYGVENVSQNAEIHDKKFTHKKMTLPSGKEISYQGYEDIAIRKLLEKYSEEEIILSKKEIPEIWYFDVDKKRRYFPDIWIPSQNLIIEVKSTWTYEKDLQKNLKKRQATLELGYNFQFWICSDKQILNIL